MSAAVYVFPGRFDDRAEFKPADPEKFRTARLKLAGKRAEVVFRKPKSKRSLEQNKWHWGIAVPMIADSLGYDRHEYKEVHYALVAKCFGTKFDPKLKIEIPNKRSSELTTREFAELMEWEVRYAAQEWGVVLPLPGEAE